MGVNPPVNIENYNSTIVTSAATIICAMIEKGIFSDDSRQAGREICDLIPKIERAFRAE